MKNLYVLLFAFVLFSCGKDNDEPKPVSKLVGTWTAVSSSTSMMVDGMTYEAYLISLGFPEEMAAEFAAQMEEAATLTDFFAEWEFKSDNKWSGTSEFVTTPVTGGWTLSDDQKTLTVTNDAEAGTQVATITKLDETDLWMEIDLLQGQLPEGTPANFSYKATLKFVRKK